jgi:hypothetical protein
MPVQSCRVSFRDADGTAHVAEVQAASLYEAAVLGLKSLNRSDWIDVIGPYTRITVRVNDPPVERFVLFMQLNRWLEAEGRTPAESLKKARLRTLLAT